MIDDRLQFFKGIKYPDFPNNFMSYFEQSMALYDLLKEVNQDVKIIAEGIDPDSINFNIKANERVCNYTKDLVDTIGMSTQYGKRYSIRVVGTTKTSIGLEIKKTEEVKEMVNRERD